MELPHTQFFTELVRSHRSPDSKLTWEELCNQVVRRIPTKQKQTYNQWGERIHDEDDDVVNDGDELYMSRQILSRLSTMPGYIHNPTVNKYLLAVLRFEDAIHIPFLQIDNSTGIITDWNRAMVDLTGLSKSDVVGKTYANVLQDWAPNLSSEYREAAVNWVSKEKDEPMGEGDYFADNLQNKTKKRGHYMFPLPLPVKHTFQNANSGDCWYIELLACRASSLTDCYSCHMFTYWQMKTTQGWIGGAEFTLRRKPVLPSPRSVAGVVDGDGSSNAFADTVSAQPASLRAAHAGIDSSDGDVYDVITSYVRSCSSSGVEYLREVLYHVKMAMRSMVVNPKKPYNFSKDWSTVSDTSDINKTVMKALGGEGIVQQTVAGGKMVWHLSFTSSYTNKDINKQFELQSKRRQWEKLWKKFLKVVAPAVGESIHSRSLCASVDTPNIIPGIDHPQRTLLTLKIEGIDRSSGSDIEEPFKAWASVQVPATLNFFQLHRVVNQTMNCSNYCTRETHVWKVQNIAPELDCSKGKYGHLDLVELGETYFIEGGERASWNEDCSLFGDGGAIRQRLSKTAAQYDQITPLYYDEFSSSLSSRNYSASKISACIHSTAISAIFYQVGTSAVLENGMVKYCSRYKITCTKIEEYKGPLPENSNINVMLSKCLRGKNEDDHYSSRDWSVDRANGQLLKDRGCLRRNLCAIGTEKGMQVFPWCWSGDFLFGSTQTPSAPLATELKGIDNRPMFLFGEPPLPGSSNYTNYVSSLEGRIDESFLQENVVNMSEFAVPFEKGRSRKFKRMYHSYDEDKTDDTKELCLGLLWERDVDEEDKRIESLHPKKKAKGKKRKADSVSNKA